MHREGGGVHVHPVHPPLGTPLRVNLNKYIWYLEIRGLRIISYRFVAGSYGMEFIWRSPLPTYFLHLITNSQYSGRFDWARLQLPVVVSNLFRFKFKTKYVSGSLSGYCYNRLLYFPQLRLVDLNV